VDHMVVFTVGLRHVGKEIYGRLQIVLRAVAVPVDDYVEVIGDGGLHNPFYLGLVVSGKLDIPTLIFHPHGSADQACIPVLFYPGHHFLRIKLFTAPAVVAPEETGSGNTPRLTIKEYLIATDTDGHYGCHRIGAGGR